MHVLCLIHNIMYLAWVEKIITDEFLVPHWTQSWTVSNFCHLTSSFAAVITAAATRGCFWTVKVNMRRSKLLAQLTKCIWSFLWWGRPIMTETRWHLSPVPKQCDGCSLPATIILDFWSYGCSLVRQKNMEWCGLRSWILSYFIKLCTWQKLPYKSLTVDFSFHKQQRSDSIKLFFWREWACCSDMPELLKWSYLEVSRFTWFNNILLFFLKM